MLDGECKEMELAFGRPESTAVKRLSLDWDVSYGVPPYSRLGEAEELSVGEGLGPQASIGRTKLESALYLSEVLLPLSATGMGISIESIASDNKGCFKPHECVSLQPRSWYILDNNTSFAKVDIVGTGIAHVTITLTDGQLYTYAIAIK